MLSCVGRCLGMGRSPVHGVLPKCLKGLTASGVNCESERATGANPWNLEQGHQVNACVGSVDYPSSNLLNGFLLNLVLEIYIRRCEASLISFLTGPIQFLLYLKMKNIFVSLENFASDETLVHAARCSFQVKHFKYWTKYNERHLLSLCRLMSAVLLAL